MSPILYFCEMSGFETIKLSQPLIAPFFQFHTVTCNTSDHSVVSTQKKSGVTWEAHVIPQQGMKHCSVLKDELAGWMTPHCSKFGSCQ